MDPQRALEIAVEKNDYERVRVLLLQRVYVNPPYYKEPDNGNLLHTLSYDGGTSSVTNLLIAAGSEIDAVNHRGQTPLMFACLWKHYEVAVALIEGGADVNAQNFRGISVITQAGYNIRARRDPNDETVSFHLFKKIHAYGLKTNGLDIPDLIRQFSKPEYISILQELLKSDAPRQPKSLTELSKNIVRSTIIDANPELNLVFLLQYKSGLAKHFRNLILGTSDY